VAATVTATAILLEAAGTKAAATATATAIPQEAGMEAAAPAA